MTSVRRGASRGVARRNAKLAALRRLVSPDRPVLAADLASRYQAAVVCDHDWVVLACEPAGHRWKPLAVTAQAHRIPAVCMQPLLVRRGREGEDFTRSRLRLRRYGHHRPAGQRAALLRPVSARGAVGPAASPGARQDGLLVRASASREQLRGLLECGWPAMLETAAEPLESMTWRAALAVSADPAVIAAMSEEEFLAALRAQLAALGGQKVWHRIAGAIRATAADPGGIAAERAAILQRAAFARGDWMTALAALADVEARMVAVLGELDLAGLVTTIPGLSAAGAAVILAEAISQYSRNGP